MANKSKILAQVFEYATEKLLKEKFIPGKDYIPPTFPELLPQDIQTLVEVSLGGWYTEWTWAAKFKRALCERLTQSHAVLTNSGSSANLVAVQACVDQEENHSRKLVLTTATGFPTTVSSIYQAGKIPFYIDIIPETLTPNLEQIYRAIDKHGKDICGAIFAHTLGFPYEEYTIADMLGSNRWLIADCADALGSTWFDPISGTYRSVGYHADAMTLSFFPAHHLMSGEGGCVLTSNGNLFDVVSSLVSWGKNCVCAPGQNNVCGKRFCHPEHGNMPENWDHKYLFTKLGYNLHMTDLQAGLGYSQLSHVDEMNAKRWMNYKYLRTRLDDLYPMISFINISDFSYPIPFGFPILVQEDADKLIAFLEANKIGTRRVFGGNLIRQPAFKDLPFLRSQSLDGSDVVMNNMFWIACGPTLTKEMMDYMVEILYEYFEG